MIEAFRIGAWHRGEDREFEQHGNRVAEHQEGGKSRRGKDMAVREGSLTNP